jgi:hypothetical protein
MKMSLELVSRDGVNACMSVTIRLPPVGCCSIELVHSKKDFLVIRALGDHEFLLNSLRLIFDFHWVLGLGECGSVSSQEFSKPGLRWWLMNRGFRSSASRSFRFSFFLNYFVIITITLPIIPVHIECPVYYYVSCPASVHMLGLLSIGAPYEFIHFLCI